jgi:hypothetical protein
MHKESNLAKPGGQVRLDVRHDFVTKLAKIKKPLVAIEELVWNSLDADANKVTVALKRNSMGSIDEILVEDDGLGIDPFSIERTFGSLGGSLKQSQHRTQQGRVVHGKEGKGRFRAFGLGSRVIWRSRFRDNSGKLMEWTITGDTADLCSFRFLEPVPSTAAGTGTTVSVTNQLINWGSLLDTSARLELTVRLAIYLQAYPTLDVVFDGESLNVAAAQTKVNEYDLESPFEKQDDYTAKLLIVEWKGEVDRKLYLCTDGGVARKDELPGIQARGFNFTAYLMSRALTSMTNEDLDMSDMNPGLRAMTEGAKKKLRDHFKERDMERAAELVGRWKKDGIYPYRGEALDAVGKAEREVFDICALSINERVPDFEKTSTESKRLTMRLVRQALETNPGSLRRILQEVLDLNKGQQDDLAELLQRTKLSAIIKAAKTIADRLTFLGSLRQMLFEPVLHKTLKERSQLQRILVNELWIFGEQYSIGTDDQGLKAILEKHLKLLERETLAAEVKDIYGEESIPDLMLYRQYAERSEGKFQHLVIELKRPSVKLGSKEIDQIKKYAYSIAADPRFDKEQTQWTFLLVSTDLDEFAELECQQNDREFGHIVSKNNLNVHVKRWATIISDCRWRYDFYREALELEVQDDEAKAYLEKKYAEYLPKPKAASSVPVSTELGASVGDLAEQVPPWRISCHTRIGAAVAAVGVKHVGSPASRVKGCTKVLTRTFTSACEAHCALRSWSATSRSDSGRRNGAASATPICMLHLSWAPNTAGRNRSSPPHALASTRCPCETRLPRSAGRRVSWFVQV